MLLDFEQAFLMYILLLSGNETFSNDVAFFIYWSLLVVARNKNNTTMVAAGYNYMRRNNVDCFRKNCVPSI